MFTDEHGQDAHVDRWRHTLASVDGSLSYLHTRIDDDYIKDRSLLWFISALCVFQRQVLCWYKGACVYVCVCASNERQKGFLRHLISVFLKADHFKSFSIFCLFTVYRGFWLFFFFQPRWEERCVLMFSLKKCFQTKFSIIQMTVNLLKMNSPYVT